MKVGDEYYFYQNDHLGTPQKLTAINGAVVWSAKYTAFGKAEIDPTSTVTSNLRFPGQYFDEESGLHYNYFRFYDSETGRYLKVDPIGLYGGMNLYTYVSNDPINWVDVFGLCPCGNPQDVINNARSDTRNWSRTADRKDINKGFGPGTYKCNLFVDTMYEEAGFNLPNRGGGFWARFFEMNPPGAYSLSDPNYRLSGWPVVTGPARPGDLIAEGGHVGIYAGNNKTLSASSTGKVENDWGFRPFQHPVVRRCSCN